ncbi:NADPH:quinone reductase-like Zn-dependent oxidoreductase [Streptomyces canus]|nr:NADPH:quinone reductase-like Zn-dependent oxidoreductase [Streptomyces canus]
MASDTAWAALDRLKASEGETLLIHAASRSSRPSPPARG